MLRGFISSLNKLDEERFEEKKQKKGNIAVGRRERWTFPITLCRHHSPIFAWYIIRTCVHKSGVCDKSLMLRFCSARYAYVYVRILLLLCRSNGNARVRSDIYCSHSTVVYPLNSHRDVSGPNGPSTYFRM